jgi:beta-N-acetylhexosaminidase
MEWWLWANEYGVNPENCAKVGILKAYQVEKTDNGTVNLKEQPVSGNASVEGILPNIMRTVPAQVGPGTPALIASRKPLPGDVIAAAIGNNPGVANGIGRREFLAAIAGGALSFLSERTVAQYGGGSTSGNFPTTGTGVGPSAKIPEWQLIYGRLTIPEKVAQLMSMGFSTTNPLEDPWAMDLFSKGIGVFTLYPPNMENPEQVARMLLDIRKQCKVSPIFNVDRETGRLDNTPAGSTMFPGNMALGAIATADMALGEELAWQVSYTVGNELRAMGINWNLAPVADVNSNPKNPVIGIRSFGEDPATVAALTRKTVEGYRMVGVSCTAKHFPGHGDAAEDSHALLWAINRPKPDIDATELPPFEAAVSAEVDAVMTAHLGFPAYDSAMMEVKDPKDPTKTVEMNTPATMSKPILTGLLREEMKFQGVIISDAMEMGAIIDNIGIGEASVRAILAGADCIITGADPVFLDSLWQGKFGRHYTVADQYEAYNAILQAVSTEGFKARNGEVLRISPERLAESVKRVLQLKFDRPPITKAVPWAMPGEDVTTPKAAKIIVGNPFYRKSAQLVADASITLVKCASGRSLEGVSPEQKILVVYPQFERLTPADNSFNEAVSLDNQIRQYHENTQAVMVRKPVPADETPGQKAARESQEAALREKRPDLKMTTDIDEIVASAKDSEVVIVPTYFGHQSEFQTSLVKRLIATGKRVVVIAMGNPYDISGFPEVDTYLCTYSVREPSMLAAAKALFGKLNKVRQTKPGEEGIEGSVMYPDWLEVDKIKDGTQLRPSRIPFTYGEPGFTGRLPVTIEGIAEKGDGLSSFAEGATRRATGAAAGESAVARAEGAAAVQNPKAQTIVTLDTKAIAAKKSVLVIDELLGRGTETQKYIADAENFGFKTVDLLTAALTKEEASEEGKNYDLVVLRDASGQFILLGQNLDLTLPDTSLEDGRLKSEIDTWL